MWKDGGGMEGDRRGGRNRDGKREAGGRREEKMVTEKVGQNRQTILYGTAFIILFSMILYYT